MNAVISFIIPLPFTVRGAARVKPRNQAAQTLSGAFNPAASMTAALGQIFWQDYMTLEDRARIGWDASDTSEDFD